MAKVYICTGGCSGVSPVMKNCGAQTCSRSNMPLTEKTQCAACEAKTAGDGAAHACPNCK